MDTPADWIAVLSRVLHVGTAIVMVGGTVFMRYVLLPAATSTLSSDVHGQLRAGVINLWRRFVHAGVALLLLSGAWNFGRVILQLREGGIRDPQYHATMGIKILLALAIFFIASMLVGRSTRADAWRANARRWLTVNIVLALLIVSMSGYLRIRGRPAPASPPVAVPEATLE